MKLFVLIPLLASFGILALTGQAQNSKSQAKFSIDSLLPSSSAVRMSEVRKAFDKALNYTKSSARRSIIEYGAIPNDGVDDAASINAALSTESEVYIPAGTYHVSSQIDVPSNRVIYGDGTNSVIKAMTDGISVINCFNSSGRTNIEIKNIAIDGGGQTLNIRTGVRNARGITINNATNININNVSIIKCGIMHPSNDTIDAGYGGYGIIISARNGESRNITVENVYISDIAGGGMISGDGIYIEGYNDNPKISLKAVVINNAYIERVGRHCITVGGDPPHSPGTNVVIRNCTGKFAALSGIDLEEGCNTIVENCFFESCGTYTQYYNPTTYYGNEYRLRGAIAYGNDSHYNIFRNIKVNKCQFGVTLGAGDFNTLNSVIIDSSVINDIKVGTARFGENLTLINCLLLTPNLSGTDWYNGTSNSDLLIENCVFASPTKIGGLQEAVFKQCNFKRKVYFPNNSCSNITFDKCSFLDSDYGIHFNGENAYTDKVVIKNSDFIGSDFGILAVYHSIKDLSIENCFFSSIDSTAIKHTNCDNETPFSRISDNVFDGVINGIQLIQALKYATIVGNRFRNVQNWCIDNDYIIFGTSTTDCFISNNNAVLNCVNGLRISIATGSFDYNTIVRNNMRSCTGTSNSISVGNANGFIEQNFF